MDNDTKYIASTFFMQGHPHKAIGDATFSYDFSPEDKIDLNIEFSIIIEFDNFSNSLPATYFSKTIQLTGGKGK